MVVSRLGRPKGLTNYDDLAKNVIILIEEIVIIREIQLTTLFEVDYDQFGSSHIFIHLFFYFKVVTGLTPKQFA
jgi:hypothetical protein